MTDNEIIKALECCINNGDCRECALNPKKGNYGYCTGLAIKSALDLINRQKAENERLTIRLRKAEHQLDDVMKMYNIIKAEAYKECIEKVKPIIGEIVDLMFDDNESRCRIQGCHYPSNIPCGNKICIQENTEYWYSKLDNLLKEMGG